jgi:hypothetical protein
MCPAVYEPLILPPTFRGRYPHMAKRDNVVWERFLTGYAESFLGFAYDVAVGGRPLALPGLDEASRLGWQYNTALKIDAVGFTAAQAWIIEVRPDATVSALGAALTYTMVAERDAVFRFKLLPVIVCETIQPDVGWACQQLAVHVVKV